MIDELPIIHLLFDKGKQLSKMQRSLGIEKETDRIQVYHRRFK